MADKRVVKVGGAPGLFIGIAILLLSIAAAFAGWGVLWRAWDWAV